MKLLIFLFTFSITIQVHAQGTLADLTGTWQFTALRQNGQLLAPPNPDLILLFKFDGQGASDLFWSRKNQTGFCEHKGVYSVDNGILDEKVTWVNPDNLPECSSDPDMQMGREIKNAYRIVEGKLETDFNLGDGHLTYIWSQVPPTP